MTDAKAFGLGLDGAERLNQMTKAGLEQALQAELADHLGHESGEAAGAREREPA